MEIRGCIPFHSSSKDIELMNIFYLSGICPYPDRPSGGPFILRRIREVLKKTDHTDVYSILRMDSPMTKGIKKILKREVRPFDRTIRQMDFGNFVWNYLYFQPGFWELLWNYWSPQKLLEQMAQVLLEEVDFSAFHLIHVQWAFPEGYMAKIIGEKHSLPYIVTAQGSDIHTQFHRSKRTRKFFIEGLEGAQKALFVSQGLLERAKVLGYSGKNSVVIPNGTDTEIFAPLDKGEIRENLGLTQKVVGFVGQLIEVKRADKFPEIFQQIRKNLPDVEFLLVGEGPLRGFLENRCRDLGLKVHFSGSVQPDEVARYLNGMDVMILPSRHEGLACVMMEGQSCGVPVIASNCEGALEGLGNPAWIVGEGPNFEERFAAKVVEILKNPPLPQTVREKVLPYDWKKIVQREWEVYEEVLENWKKKETNPGLSLPSGCPRRSGQLHSCPRDPSGS